MKYSLRLTWQRIIVSLIILFVFFFLPIVPVQNQIQCVRAPCPPVSTILAPFQMFSPSIIFTYWTYGFLFLEIIVAYLLACFLTMRTKDFYP